MTASLSLVWALSCLLQSPGTPQPTSSEVAQRDPAPATRQDGEVEALAKRVQQAHRPGGSTEAVTAFEGTLHLTPLDSAEDSVEVGLEVRFREGKRTPRIRYRLLEAGHTTERGQDQRGMWMRYDADSEPIALMTKEYTKDRESVLRDIQLARQLLQFLDPAAVVRSLSEVELGEAALPLGHGQSRAARTIAGDVDRFPLYVTHESTKAHVKLWIDAETGRVLQALAVPIGDNGRLEPVGERILLQDLTERSGILLPTTLLFYRVERGKDDQPDAKVELRSIDLDPPLPEALFDRANDW